MENYSDRNDKEDIRNRVRRIQIEKLRKRAKNSRDEIKRERIDIAKDLVKAVGAPALVVGAFYGISTLVTYPIESRDLKYLAELAIWGYGTVKYGIPAVLYSAMKFGEVEDSLRGIKISKNNLKNLKREIEEKELEIKVSSN
ncbi:MAG: hypothetical protein ABIH49_01940 [archaeon]